MDWLRMILRVLLFLFGTMIAGLDGGIAVAIAILVDSGYEKWFRKK